MDVNTEGQEQNNINSENNNIDFTIPEEYQDKGWTKFFDGKTGDELKTELFRSYDNSQALIGKKVEDYIKNTDLKSLENYDAIKQALTKQITPEVEVPNDIAEYNLANLLKNENGEQILTIEDSALEFFGNKFKELGFSKEKAQDLFNSYVKYGIEEFHKFTNADELENDINKMFNGNKVQRTTCENLIKEFLSKEDLGIIQNSVPNVVVEMFYKVANGLVNKYGYKESSTGSNNPAKIRMSEADKNAEYDRLVKRLQDLDNNPHQKVGERDEILKAMKAIFE